MSDCIFCKIVAGQIPAAKIYEDSRVLAFLDINPVNQGHVLLIPKEHFPTIVDTPDELVGYIFSKAKVLMPAIKAATDADFVAITIIGTDVPHFHVHLIPRRHNDGLTGFWPTKKYTGDDMKITAEKIKNSF